MIVSSEPNALVRWWEGLSLRTQALVAIPALAVLLFAINLGPFNQPLLRSVLYGLFEGGVLGGLLLAVTAQEKAKRTSRGGSRSSHQDHEPSADQGDRDGDAENLSGEP